MSDWKPIEIAPRDRNIIAWDPAWPEWMTPQKRREMAANFEQHAIEVDAILHAGGISPSRGQGVLK